MGVLYEELIPISAIQFSFPRQSLRGIGLLKQCVANVFFVGKDIVDGRAPPKAA